MNSFAILPPTISRFWCLFSYILTQFIKNNAANFLIVLFIVRTVSNFKFNSKITRMMCGFCSKSTIITQGQCVEFVPS